MSGCGGMMVCMSIFVCLTVSESVSKWENVCVCVYVSVSQYVWVSLSVCPCLCAWVFMCELYHSEGSRSQTRWSLKMDQFRSLILGEVEHTYWVTTIQNTQKQAHKYTHKKLRHRHTQSHKNRIALQERGHWQTQTTSPKNILTYSHFELAPKKSWRKTEQQKWTEWRWWKMTPWITFFKDVYLFLTQQILSKYHF